MTYKVISRFFDKEDKDQRVYEVGDEYKGKVNKDRLHTLTTSENAYGRPFIEEISKEDLEALYLQEQAKKIGEATRSTKKAKKEAGE